MALHFRGELGDGHVHLTAEEIIGHNIRERHENENRLLRKLANNPAIAPEFRKVLWAAIRRSRQVESWRNAYVNLLKEHDVQKHINQPRLITYDEMMEINRKKAESNGSDP